MHTYLGNLRNILIYILSLHKQLARRNHKLYFIITKYANTTDINLSIDTQNSYSQCIKQNVLNNSPGINISLADMENIFIRLEKLGHIMNVRCLVLCLRDGICCQGIGKV